MAVTVLRRTYKGEQRWFPLLQELGYRRLRAALVESGMSPQIAGGVVWFLDDQMMLDRHQDQGSRTRYRQMLAELDPDQVLELGRAIPGQFNSRQAA